MTGILPAARPRVPRSVAAAVLATKGLTAPEPAILGLRGFFRQAMSKGVDQRGLYECAICLVTPDSILAVNANTLPTGSHPGEAVLDCGTWSYKMGIHNLSKDPAVHPHYPALVQAATVTVSRDGQTAKDTGMFGINIHHGSYTMTSSEGCQTIHPDQWEQFITAVKATIGDRTIPYCLVEASS